MILWMVLWMVSVGFGVPILCLLIYVIIMTWYVMILFVLDTWEGFWYKNKNKKLRRGSNPVRPHRY